MINVRLKLTVITRTITVNKWKRKIIKLFDELNPLSNWRKAWTTSKTLLSLGINWITQFVDRLDLTETNLPILINRTGSDVLTSPTRITIDIISKKISPLKSIARVIRRSREKWQIRPRNTSRLQLKTRGLRRTGPGGLVRYSCTSCTDTNDGKMYADTFWYIREIARPGLSTGSKWRFIPDAVSTRRSWRKTLNTGPQVPVTIAGARVILLYSTRCTSEKKKIWKKN